MKILYFDCIGGISGDMILAALLDAGLDFDMLKIELKKLNIAGYSLKKFKVKQGHSRATKFEVIVKNRRGRSLNQIFSLIQKSRLDKKIKEDAVRVYKNIAAAENSIHGKNYHLHQLSETDSIIDIIGFAIAKTKLGIEKIYVSDIPLGKAAPATIRLLNGFRVKFSNLEFESTTPTAAAIIKTFCQPGQPLSPITLEKAGYGAGTYRIPDYQNLLRIAIGEISEDLLESETITVIETNIDDMNPVSFQYLFERLFDAGALDVYTVPIHMKKSRPAVILKVLSKNENTAKLSEIIFEETSTFGIRHYQVIRKTLKRTTKKVKTKYGAVSVKIGKLDGRIVSVSPEYEDCRRVAVREKIAFKDIYSEAKTKAESRLNQAANFT